MDDSIRLFYTTLKTDTLLAGYVLLAGEVQDIASTNCTPSSTVLSLGRTIQQNPQMSGAQFHEGKNYGKR
jgi:hypothetical protein